MVAPSLCWLSVWNLLHVSLLAPRILRLLLDLWQFLCKYCVNTSQIVASQQITYNVQCMLHSLYNIPSHKYELWPKYVPKYFT